MYFTKQVAQVERLHLTDTFLVCQHNRLPKITNILMRSKVESNAMGYQIDVCVSQSK